MSTTKRLIAACAALTISFVAFAVPANARSMVKRNRPHHHMMMHHHMMRHHMMHHRGMMMHHRGMMHHHAM